MNTMIAVYSDNAYQEYLLPAVNNENYDLVIRKEAFVLEHDIVLQFENLDGVWYLLNSQDYHLEEEQSVKKRLENGVTFGIISDCGSKVICAVTSSEGLFFDYCKFDISDMSRITIGSGKENDISYQYENMVSSNHVLIQRVERGFGVRDLSEVGFYLNNEKVKGSSPLKTGDCLILPGLKVVYLGDIIAVSDTREEYLTIGPELKKSGLRENSGKKALHTAEKPVFHRSPRYYTPIKEEVIEIEFPPQRSSVRAMDAKYNNFWYLLGLCLLGVVCFVLFLFAGNISKEGIERIVIIGAFSLVSFFALAAVNLKYQRKHMQEDCLREEQNKCKQYLDYLEVREKMIREKYDNQTEILHHMYPPAREVITYNEKTALLWNRNRNHKDFLYYRVGLGEQKSATRIELKKEHMSWEQDELVQRVNSIRANYEMLKNVPVWIDLAACKLYGVVGGKDKSGCYDFARSLIAQIAACNCYTEVKIALIYDEISDRGDWEYVRWLPHVFSQDRKTRYIATNRSEAGEVFYDLLQILRSRAEKSNDKKHKFEKPYYIVFVASPELLEGEPISKYLLDGENTSGVSTFLLVSSEEQLPNGCVNIIQNNDDRKEIYNVNDDYVTKVDYDEVSAREMSKFSRRLLSISVNEAEESSEVPNSLTFFEMWRINRICDLPVRDMWRKSRTYDSINALIGRKAGDAPLYLDIHEKYHGPHGLIAGTTGSGKSELLQTMILSLALQYSPEDIAFFLIDYKGGGLAGQFEELPHLVGAVTNLSGNRIKRAMISVKSENKRRQALFNANHVNNINHYTRLYKNGEVKTPLPHLLIIVDEFAELKREEPEFMKELISVTQVGRSLGVHLIIATQKPSGNVDDNILSNSKFRICLRVQERQDSIDMLHKADAAFITQIGRGYFQVGNDELYEQFQTGYSGAIFDENAIAVGNATASLMSTNGKATLVGNRALRVHQEEDRQESASERTQLQQTVKYINQIAKEDGYNKSMTLWLPPLVTEIALEDLVVQKRTQESENKADYVLEENRKKNTVFSTKLTTVIGIADDPEQQMQYPVEVDVENCGNIAVIGSIRSGKSTFLQTFIYGLMLKYSPEIVSFYIIDFSSRSLACFREAPHVGCVLFEEDMEYIDKFFVLLRRILAERKKEFAGGTYVQRKSIQGNTVPLIFIAVDNYGTFVEKTDGRYESEVLSLMKEGVSYGIQFLITAAGIHSSEIRAGMEESIKTIFTLQLNDKYAYTDSLRELKIPIVPESNVVGRGLVKLDGRILEYQVAIPIKDKDAYSRMDKMEAQCKRMSDEYRGVRAMVIPIVPETLTWAEFEKTTEFKEAVHNGLLPIGYDTENAALFSMDLSKNHVFMISGRSMTGKTNSMKQILLSAKYYHAQSVVMEFNRKELREETEANGGIYCSSIVACSEVLEKLSEEQPVFILISDLEELIQMCDQNEMSAETVIEKLTMIIRGSEKNGVYLFAGVNPNTVSNIIGDKLYRRLTGVGIGWHLGGIADHIRYMDFSQYSYSERKQNCSAGIAMLPVTVSGTKKYIKLPLVEKK